MEENNKRIVRNTVYLYVRMLVMTALGFVTTRIVLEKLGASDYGIYSLLGGFVAMFTVLNSILSTGTSRFIALALGKKDLILQKNFFYSFCYSFGDCSGCFDSIGIFWSMVYQLELKHRCE